MENRVANPEATDNDLFGDIRERVLRIVAMILVALQRYSPHLAEDLTQDVLVKLLKLKTVQSFDPKKGSLRAWLYGVIRWTVVAAIRRERLVLGEPAERLDMLADSGPTPDQRIDQMELVELVQAWIVQLTDKQRTAVERKFIPKPGEADDTPETSKERVNRSRGLTTLRKIAKAKM